MIVVDTSVWVDASRRPHEHHARTLGRLIDADEVALALPVRLELVAGMARANRAAFRRALTALPVLVPTEDTWRVVEAWIDPAADAGHRFAVTGLIVAGLAREIGALVWSLDSDFARMETLGFAALYRAP